MAVPAATRERMRLMWRDGLKVAEIARRTGVTPNTVTGVAPRDRAAFPARGRRTVPSLDELTRGRRW